MEISVPRIIIAGTNSGCGKTTVTCAVLQALINRRIRAGAFKCGPDYIDPMFHKKVIGAHSSNLDPYFFDRNTMKYLLAKNGAGMDISVIEGVMGFYDGMGINTEKASTYEVSEITETPVLLVVSARGAAMSVLAQIHGFLTFHPNNNIKGVILNQCTESAYRVLAAETEKRFSGTVRLMGFIPNDAECRIESRHLGLVTADEICGLHEKLNTLSKYAEKYIDLDGIMELARSAPAISFDPPAIRKLNQSVRIAIARDDAFCFYYDDALELLTEMGAELVPFSPLKDRELPDNTHGIILGGGYPELYAEKLSENKTMLLSLRQALERGVPCIAECGGFMYLTEYIGGFPMVGFIPGKCEDSGKLKRFGYLKLKAAKDNMLCRAGEEIPAHEFHHWDADNTGADFHAEKLSGTSWDAVFATERLYAGFPHFHFYSDPSLAVRFLESCLKR